ncbi:unnamed protein product, partial [Mesorhabditis spiculigera]
MLNYEFVDSYIVFEDQLRKNPPFVRRVKLPTRSNVLSGTPLIDKLRGKTLKTPGIKSIQREVRMDHHIPAYLDCLNDEELGRYAFTTIHDFAAFRNWRAHRLAKRDNPYACNFMRYKRAPIVIFVCKKPRPDATGELSDNEKSMLLYGKNLEKYASIDPMFGAINLSWVAYHAPFIKTCVALHDYGVIKEVKTLNVQKQETKDILQAADRDWESMARQFWEKIFKSGNLSSFIDVASAILRMDCRIYEISRYG